MRRILFTTLVLGLLSGCPGSSSSGAASGDTAPAPREVKPLTETSRAKLREVGEAFAAALSAEDLDAAARFWDGAGLWSRVADGLDLSSEVERQAKRSFIAQFKAKGGVPLYELAGQRVDFRRINEDPKQGALLLLRGILPDGSLLYAECLVDDPDAAEPKLIDVYAYANGEFVSRTARRLMAPQLAEASRAPLSKLLGGTSEDSKHFPKLQSAMESLHAGDAQGALQTLDALPASIRRQKSVLIMRLRAASVLYDPAQVPPVGEEAYLAVLGEMKDALSTDPRAQLLLTDYHLLKQDYDAFHASLETLEGAVGEDAYLTLLHATGYYQAEEHEKAVELGFAALEQEPELDEQLRLNLVDFLLAAERYEELADMLRELTARYGYAWDVAEEPSFDGFLESEPGKAWWKEHQAGE